MRRVFGWLICVVVVAIACSKPAGVTITAEEQLTNDLKLIDDYLALYNIPGIKHDSIRYVIHELGTGDVAGPDKCVRFKYNAYSMFDSVQFDHNDAGYKTPYKTLIIGMRIALKQMPMGTKATIYIPSGLAYGPAGQYDGVNSVYIVNPNTNLRFEVETMELYDYNTLGNYCYE